MMYGTYCFLFLCFCGDSAFFLIYCNSLFRKKGIAVHQTRHKRAFRFWMFLLFFFGCLLGGFWLFEAHFAAIVRDTAETAVKAKAAYIINDAIAEQTAKDKITYDSLVTFEKDKNGSITALKTNTTAINRFKSALSLAIVNALEQTEAVGFEIPLGTILQSELAAGKGPMVRVHILPIGTVETRVKNSLESAGINQSCHRIYICVRAELVVVTAATRQTTFVETEVCVAETVVVGNVPGYYADIDLTK